MQSEQTQIHTQPARRKVPGWLLAFGIALLAAGIMFLPFIIYEKGNFFFFGDFNVQQIPFYRMAHDAVRSGEVLWNSYTDLGANFIASYSFYLLFSPFFWLTLPFPSEMVPYLMAPLLMLKTASMALTSYFYIRRFVRTDEYAIIGSLCYAFSGFATYNIFFNHFHEAMVFFPLLLIGVEELVQNRRRGVFALAVAVNCIVNYWFFIGEVVFVVLYVFLRMTDRSWGMTVKRFCAVALESVLGLCLAMVVLLPSVLAIMGNPRTTSDNLLYGWNFWIYSTVQRIPQILQTLFFPPELPSRPNFFPDGGAKWSSLSAWLPLFGVSGTAAFLLAARRSWLKKLLFTCLFMALVPGLNSAFILFNNSYYARWFYMPVLLMCLATATALERRDIDYVRGVRWYAGGVLLFMVACGLTPSKTSEGEWKLGLMDEPIRFWLVCLIAVCCVALTLWIVRQLRKNPAFVRTAIALTAAVGCLHGMFFIGSGRLYGTSGSFLRERALAGYDSIAFPGEDEDEFFRLDLYNTLDNLGMYWHVPNIQAFHSIVPNSIMEFYPYVGVKRDVSSKPEVNNYALRPLLSVKYLAVSQSEKDAENLMPGYTFSFSQFGYDFYENENYLPMGFGYTTGVRQSVLDTAPLSLRANVMLEAVGLSDEAMERNADILTELESIDYASLNASGMEEAVEERRQYTCDTFAFDKTGFTATCDLDEDVLMFFSVPYDSGWSATVNGEPVVIEKASVGFMAVRVPAGEAEIRFEYMTPGLIPGAFVSAGGLVLLGVYLLVMRRQDRRAAAADPVPASFRSLREHREESIQSAQTALTPESPAPALEQPEPETPDGKEEQDHETE